jgi:hypothetical protein
MPNTGTYVVAPVISSPWPIDTPLSAGTFDIITERFDATLAKADDMYTLLVGPDGHSGYLGDMETAISSAPAVSILAPYVDTSFSLVTSGASVPVFDAGTLKSYPTASYTAPTMTDLPAIDTGDLTGIPLPDTVSADFAWSAGSIPTSLFDAIMARMLTDLTSGATGLNPAVEAAIFDRARVKQQVSRDAAYAKLNADISSRGFSLPPGALVSALVDFSAEGIRQDADINNNIIATQGELAQKNSQFMMQQAVTLEKLIRDSVSETDKAALDFAKSRSDALVRNYAEQVRSYIAVWEGKKARIQAQAEALKGVIEGNRGLIDIFKAQWDSYKTNVEAIASANKGVTDAFLGQVQGFAENERAITSKNVSGTEIIKSRVMAAELELKAAIAQAEHLVAGYTAEMSLKEKVSADMTHVTSQVCASMLSAVSASASLGYSGSSSESKSVSNSASISESHSYEHDPLS